MKNSVKYYVYLSLSKIDMIFNQMSFKNKINYLFEVKLNIPFLSLRHQSETEKEDKYYKKLNKVVNYLSNAKSIFDDNPSYISGTLNMSMATLKIDNNALFWIGKSENNGNTANVLLIGSAHNLCGSKVDEKAEVHYSPLCNFIDAYSKELELKKRNKKASYKSDIVSIIEAIILEQEFNTLPQSSEYEFLAKCLAYKQFERTDGTKFNYIIASPIYVAKT